MKQFCFIVFLTMTCLSLTGQKSDFDIQYEKLVKRYVVENKVDYTAINKSTLDQINLALANTELRNINHNSDFSFLINVYNFLVIFQVKEHYPISSVKDVPVFFDKPFQIGEINLSLNDLEQQIINQSGNANFHLLLNCGAISCPPIHYISRDADLNALSLKILTNNKIASINHEKRNIKLSKIFFWYLADFGTEKDIKKQIADIKDNQNLTKYKVTYFNYNWLLNDLSSNDYLIYYPTKLYKKGGWELKIFNNYYTQSDNGFRSNFFSSFIQLQIGSNKNINFGLDVKLRSVNQGNVGLFSALNFKTELFNFDNDVLSFSRSGVSAIGPRIKYQPFKNKGHINFLHSVYFVPMNNTEGNFEFGYFDFQNIQVFNNVFIEKELSVKKRLFFDLGFHIENIKLGLSDTENHNMQIQIPVTAIYSYYPNPKATLYALANVALKPVFTYAEGSYQSVNWDGYAQLGIGAKYYITPFLELELLYTYFADRTPGRVANTFNIGLRFFKF